MLQLVLGIAATGKTTWMLQKMQELAAQGKYCVFLVPEQFSSSAETLVLETLGDVGSAFVDVVSFRTLAERLLQGADENMHLLSDAGRAVLVKRALKNTREKLKNLGRSRHDTAFCNLCAQTLVELKTAGATPCQLQGIGKKTKDTKFLDLAVLMEAYEALLAGTAMDPQDRLQLACQRAKPSWFSGKSCFIDNFDGFTAPEYELLDMLVQHCEAMYVALCCDGLHEKQGGLGLFSPSRKTAQRLLQRARRFGISTKNPIFLQHSDVAEVDELLAVNRVLSGSELPLCMPQGRLTITAARNRHEEVKLACATMRHLATQGVSYSQMALVCREVDLYESIVRREMSLFEIPWHSDTPETVEFSAPVAFVRAALKLLQQGMTSEAILDLLKTDLCGFTAEEMIALENYVFTWQPNAALWRQPFTQNPLGLLRDMDEAAVHSLQLAETVRGKLLPPLEAYVQAAKGKNAHNLSLQLYLLMEHFHAPLNQEEKAEKMEQNGDFAWAERSRRAWDLCMDFLDQMALLLAGETLDAAEYEELFLLLVRSVDFGQVPKTLESVPFASADRARLAGPEYCFVLGLQEGEFPAKVGYSGLLTHSDRDLLVENDIEMPGSFQNRLLLEQMFLYRTLTAARHCLHLSYPLQNEDTIGTPCHAVLLLQKRLNPPVLHVETENLAATQAAAFDRLALVYRDGSEESANLLAALSQSDEPYARSHLPLLHAVQVPQQFLIKDNQTLHRLTGDVLRLSPTRAERYYTCRFAYLMEHVLQIRPRKRAELSVQESGSLVHYVLEQVLKELGKEFSEVDDKRLRKLSEKYVNAFAQENFPQMNLRLYAILARIRETVFALLQYLHNWAKHSEFETEALELSLGEEQAKPLCLQSESGVAMQVVGKVDRVDVLKKNGKTYLCILDYKTGSREFSLHEVLYGLNMQMLVYMDALCRQKEGPYSGALPAGVLYLSADPSPKSGTRHDAAKSLFRMDGLLLDDASVLEALDNDKTGLFLPVTYAKNGEPKRERLASLQYMGGLFLYVESLLQDMADGLASGDFSARPLVRNGGKRYCEYCPYLASCRHEAGRNEVVMQKQEERLVDIEKHGGEEGFFHGRASMDSGTKGGD